MVHGEDLDRLNGGSESSVHFVWGRRTQQDRPAQGPWQQTTPYHCSHPIFYSLPSRESAQNVAHIVNLLNLLQLVVVNLLTMRPLQRESTAITSSATLVTIDRRPSLSGNTPANVSTDLSLKIIISLSLSHRISDRVVFTRAMTHCRNCIIILLIHLSISHILRLHSPVQSTHG